MARNQGPQPGAPDDVAVRAAEGMLGPNPFVGLRKQDILATVKQIAGQAVRHPKLVLEQQAALTRELIAALAGRSELQPPQGDKRFQDAAWKDNPFYRTCLQGYLAWSRALSNFVDKAGLDEKSRERARFVVSLLTEAAAPSNTLLGNPAALKRIIESGGASVVNGLHNRLADLLETRACRPRSTRRRSRLAGTSRCRPAVWCFVTRCWS